MGEGVLRLDRCKIYFCLWQARRADEKREIRMRGCKTCGRDTKRLSGRCAKCERDMRENGAVGQRAILKRDLHLHLQGVLASRKRTAGNAEQWATLDYQWDTVVERAWAIDQKAKSGQPFYKPAYRAAQEVLKLSKDVKSADVTNACLAMYSLLAFDGRLIKDDNSFKVQLVKAVRKLGTIGLGARWDGRQNRVGKMYRSMPPRAVDEVAGWLVAAYGFAGVTFAQTERKRIERELEEKAKVRAAVRGIFNSDDEAA
jgi:hypothetical protein